MSFFPASIPYNLFLYHGTHTKDVVTGIEWLAFEIEHAEMFARAPRKGRGPPPGNGGPPPFEKGRDEGDRRAGEKEEEEGHGYLHTYRTTHALKNLLYIDGMSAAKCGLGTLDTTDFILLNDTLVLSQAPKPKSSHQSSETQKEGDARVQINPTYPNSDYARAVGLCSLASEWGLQGFIRMEAGFELILCDFSAHVELVSVNQRVDIPDRGRAPGFGDDDGEIDVKGFEYLRGLEQRYNGITNNRIVVDYSRMVSAYFYEGLNLTNPDATKKALPRLPSKGLAGLEKVKSDLGSVLKSSGNGDGGIDWQGVADMILTRYTTRLPFLGAEETEASIMLKDIGFLLDVFIDYGKVNLTLSRSNCARQYLSPVKENLKTKADGLIYEALLVVTSTICRVLFEVREELSSTSVEDVSDESLKVAKGIVQVLMEYLDWATWKECGKCGVNEVCFVAIWPWGGIEDHEKPSCVEVGKTRGRKGYWNSQF